MEFDAIIGCAVLAGALVALVALTVWCRRRIQHIARSTGRSARELERSLRGE